MPQNSYLPPEILDHTIDLLDNEPETLKQCCIVSKSWVPRTRKHLFADIRFQSASDLESWKKTFPDVASSPAHYARTLFIGCPQSVVGADAEEGGWIQAFSGVQRLDVDNGTRFLKPLEISLTPFHRFSPTLKSFRICPILFPFPQVFDLIHSYPLLEDLTMDGRDESWFNPYDEDPHRPQPVLPSTSPVFTGSLEFHISGGAVNAARRLLDLPNGLHFRSLALTWGRVEDLWWITEFVARCSRALESLDITYIFRRTSPSYQVRANNLIAFPSWVGVGLVRPLESNKTPWCGFSIRITEHRMDQHGTQHHHTRASRPSTNFHLFAFPIDFLQYRCRYQAVNWRRDLQGVVGP